MALVKRTAGLEQTEEAIDGLLDLGVHLKTALADRRVTVDEVVSGVTDGKVRESLARVIQDIEALLQGGSTSSIWDLAESAGIALMELGVSLGEALQDKKVTVDEIVFGVTDGHVKESLRLAVEGVEKIPQELKSVNPLKLMRIFQKVMSRLGGVVKAAT